MKKKLETPEELDIVQAVDSGDYVSVGKEEFSELQSSLKQAASNTIERLSKRKAISIRLLESDITRVKAMALNEGMPYQTYLSHIIHKLTTGRLQLV